MLELSRQGSQDVDVPALAISRRILFSYRFYLYHVSTSPILAEWYKQKRVALKGESAHVGSRSTRWGARVRNISFGASMFMVDNGPLSVVDH